ncbi:hypothetical protein V6Z11_A07G187800 [Gossypium hirsutum]
MRSHNRIVTNPGRRSIHHHTTNHCCKWLVLLFLQVDHRHNHRSLECQIHDERLGQRSNQPRRMRMTLTNSKMKAKGH